MSDTYTFTADNGTHVDVPESWITGMSLDDVGLCLACGEERYGTEPDARRYPCEGCEQDKVYGVQELLMMDRLKPQPEKRHAVDNIAWSTFLS